jgi:dihydrofolate reductase
MQDRAMTGPFKFEGYVIVSEDGMIADASGAMPPSMIVPADQVFFEQGLDRADIVVHGRHSQESQTRSAQRRRVIATHGVPSIEKGATPLSVRWNPDGASFEAAAAALGVTSGIAGIIGGTGIFGYFLPSYTAFHLSRVPDVRLPGGRPVFPGVPGRTPEDILQSYGLVPGPVRLLDADTGASVVTWEPKRNRAL